MSRALRTARAGVARLVDMMTLDTAREVVLHAKRLGAQLGIGTADIALRDEEGLIFVEVHADMDGRWVVASWDARAEKYVAQIPPGRIEPGVVYRYRYGRSLRALRRGGAPAYRSAAEALATLEAP